ncbi:TIGR04222 domain-containing membrane protein [Streptomyces sp. NPDC006553]|uniref:TIGR04222 domain-containing membrane protein n=1 Tax=unclassified Streptomyces TaxID=2593676 RepID=UPI00225640C0|nr:TIGR04222 domain-containing membrane protein [Streptomyces sp. NBC_00233]MCX5229356.1 TIGR04222 domain-containing membrane protein [Streptomyces sp. NBC_00233]
MLVNVLVALYYLAGIAGITVLVTRVVRARGGPGGPVHDRYEAAFLNGGPARVVDTALAALQADGRLAIGGPGIVAVVRPVAHDPVERAVLQAHAAAPHGALHHLRTAVMRHPAVQEIGDGLAVRGLVVDPATRRTTLRWCAAVGFTALGLFPVSAVVTVVDFAAPGSASAPFLFKVAPAIIAAGFTALFCGSLAARQVTPAGRSAVLAYGRDHAHLADAALLVALHGLRALPDPVLREQLLAAARIYGPPRRRGGGGRRPASHSYAGADADDGFGAAVVWCAGTSACGGGGGGGGSSCSGGGSGSSCSSGSCSGGGSSCGGGGSSCSSSSGSSCSSSSSSGSSCSSSSS